MMRYLTFLRFLIPPQINAPPEVQYRWCWFIFIALLIIGGGGLTYIASAESLVPSVEGHAKISDVKAIAIQLRDIRIQMLETTLLLLREKQCVAIHEHNINAMRFFAERLFQVHKEYLSITEFRWEIPACEELS